MRKVGSEAVPFGNSTPTEIVVQRIERARSENESKATFKEKTKVMSDLIAVVGPNGSGKSSLNGSTLTC